LQFLCDGRTGEVFTGYEHINNEANIDKHVALAEAMSMPKVKPRGLCHDDNCDFEKWCKKRYPEIYAHIDDFVIDHFHKNNHTCPKKSGPRGKSKGGTVLTPVHVSNSTPSSDDTTSS
jgi:hypothetical protein